MTLEEMRTALKTDLADTDWSETELDRGITRAVEDLTRFLPDEKVKEITYILEKDDESWTSTTYGAYVSLANKPIKYDSEEVTSDPAGTTYERDTDYTMDYMNGEITVISGGGMAETTAYLISYEMHREALDISSITDLVRIGRVEYPLSTNEVKEFIPFAYWNDMLFISPKQFTDEYHIAIYYDAQCVAPTTGVVGSYPLFLDEIVVKGALAYCLITRGLEMADDAKDNLASSATPLATIDAILDQIDTQTAALETLFANFAAIWTDEDTYRTAAVSQLTTGSPLIDTVTKGARVGELHATYAQTYITIARLAETRVTGYSVETSARVALVAGYINEANARISEAGSYQSAADKQITLASKYFEEGIERRNEFWTVLKDKSQHRYELSLVSQRQPM